jgi:carbonic anhydrase
VPVELIFDQGFGDLFVVRLAGNIATPEVIASLEFGVAFLGAKVLYVLGHSSCGAVAATIQAEPVPGQISTLFQHIRPAIRAANGDLEASIRENVRSQASLLAEASPLIAGLIRQGKVKVVGGVFDLGTGVVEPVEV